jgi:hypothetical protein
MNSQVQAKSFIDIIDKVERLSSAVFLVSDTMADSEVLRTVTRNLALDLISKSSSLNNGSLGEKIRVISSLESISLNLYSLFQVASVSGLVSSMNASMIRENINSFLGLLKTYSADLDGAAEFHMKDKFEALKSPLDFMPQKSRVAESAPIGQPLNTTDKNVKSTRKDAREKTILDFIKTRDSVSIKDIARNVKGCSEKTIQRELLKMIESGAIKKTGERRWSRYSYNG